MKRLIPILLLSLTLAGCNLQTELTLETESTENLTGTVVVAAEKEIETKPIKPTKTIKNNYTTSTKSHDNSVGEDIFAYNNEEEILSIVSTDRPTYLENLIDNILFIDEGTSAGYRTILIYNLDNQEVILEERYYGSFEINENQNTLIYPTMTYEKPENSNITCGEQEGYFQKHSFNYKTLKSEKTGDIYCSYVE